MLPLGTWKVPGLEHFSGTMVYEKTVDVPASLLAERVLLDCGVVGVCAEVWVNGKSDGEAAVGSVRLRRDGTTPPREEPNKGPSGQYRGQCPRGGDLALQPK